MNPSRLVHPAAGRDLAADGGDHAGRHGRLSLSAALGAARGRLSDHPGADLLSRRQPRRDDLVGHRAARSAVRPDAGAQPDVVDQLGRGVGHHPAVQPRPQPRRRRAGGAGRDQRRRQSAAVRPAGAADLRQGQPGRRADPDPGADLEDVAADPGRGPRRHAAGAEDLAACRRRPGQHQRRTTRRRCGSRRNLRALAAYGLNIDDLRTTSGQRQRQHAQGQFRRADPAYTINANDQIKSAADYNDLVVAYRNGAPVQLSDVGAAQPRAPRTPSSPAGSNTSRR